jgi:hypothetical protein
VPGQDWLLYLAVHIEHALVRPLRTGFLAIFVFVGVACGGGTARPDVPTAPSSTATATVTTRASTLDSFEGQEEPAARYHPSTRTFTPDSFVNMTNPAPGLFRFVLRYRPVEDWWDGDRTTANEDRQRAEVKGLGVHQKTGETFEYATTWRTSRGGADRFWHVFQLKATDGDDAPPLIVLSLQSGSTAAVRYWPGTSSGFIVARSFPIAIGDWMTVRIRVKVDTSARGLVLASVNGDPFSGATGVPVFRPASTDYRPKWGSYRGVDGTQPYGDDVVEHMDVSAARLPD